MDSFGNEKRFFEEQFFEISEIATILSQCKYSETADTLARFEVIANSCADILIYKGKLFSNFFKGTAAEVTEIINKIIGIATEDDTFFARDFAMRLLAEMNNLRRIIEKRTVPRDGKLEKEKRILVQNLKIAAKKVNDLSSAGTGHNASEFYSEFLNYGDDNSLEIIVLFNLMREAECLKKKRATNLIPYDPSAICDNIISQCISIIRGIKLAALTKSNKIIFEAAVDNVLYKISCIDATYDKDKTREINAAITMINEFYKGWTNKTAILN